MADSINDSVEAVKNADEFWNSATFTGEDLSLSIVDLTINADDLSKAFFSVIAAQEKGLKLSDETIRRLEQERAAMFSANRIAEERAAIKKAIVDDEKLIAAELDAIIRGAIRRDEEILAEQKAAEAQAKLLKQQQAAELKAAETLARENDIMSLNDFNERIASSSDSAFANRLGALSTFNKNFLAKIKAAIASEVLLNTNKNLALKIAAADLGSSLLAIAEQSGGEFFKIAKKFAIANAIISTFQGAAKALELPFPANLVAFAAVLAQGFSAVASIKGVSPGGGASGASAGGGANTALPAAPTPVTIVDEPATEEVPEDTGLRVNINVSGFIGDEAELASKLSDLIREASGADEVNFGQNTSFAALS